MRAFPLLALFSLVSADASAGGRPDYDASLVARGGPAPRSLAGGPVVVHARDPGRGVPSLLWSAEPGPAAWIGTSPAVAARAQLLEHRGHYGVTREVIEGARVLFTHDTGRGGIIVAFRQQVGGVDVHHGDVKVLLDRSHRLIGISGSPHPSAMGAAVRSFIRAEPEAIAVALGDLYGRSFTGSHFVAATRPPRAGARYFALAPASTSATAELRFREPARVKPVYFPLGDSLVPAHFVEVQAYLAPGRPLDVVQYVVGADDGRILARRDATASEAYTYRVWADEGGDRRPTDGPLEDFTPHPTGKPDVGPVDGVKPIEITMEGLNTNPDGAADPWLPPGSTETVGNHVDAYIDHISPNGLDPSTGEFRADITSPGVFDYIYDIGSEPLSSESQSKAALVQMFYTTNWLHDWWYDSGFNEATGVAQQDNFGRGGEEGDPLHAEGQDGALEGSLNNANMATPADGASPVMQMFLWTPRKNEGTLSVAPGDVAYEVSKAAFGPLVFDLTAPLVMIEDGMGTDPQDGCEPPTNDVAGKVVLIHRGNCTFETKVTGVQMAGAVGALIANNVDEGPPSLGNDDMLEDPTLPVLGLGLPEGDALAASIKAESTAHMVGTADVMRDGTIDNMIVAHEYGHYLHHRMEDCGTPSCGAMSEGWGDFNALLMTLREGDPLDGVYASLAYSGSDPYAYFGLRRVPYTADMSKNALSFRHIADGEPLPDTHPVDDNGISNSEVHNAGEVWCTMMWEVYIGLHKAHAADMSFEEIHRLMTDYVVAGMLMTPVNPTFTDQRDALLLAIAATDKDDFFTVAEAFARRGVGSCAVAPPVDSVDFVGVKEDFQLQANGTLTGFTFDDSAQSCDNDGVVDGGETGRIHVAIANGGSKPLPAGSLVEIESPTESLEFPKGASVMLGGLAALEKTSVEFDVAVVKGLAVDEHVTVKVRLTTPEGCSSVKEIDLPVALNADVKPEASASEGAETPDAEKVWTIDGVGSSAVWSRHAVGDGHVWRGQDLGRVTDAVLISPPLKVSASESFVVGFDHAYQFEFSDATYWDGGVIEYSTDAGANWTDVATLVAVPYGGPIMSELNPIDGQMAFVDHNPAYPETDHLDLDFGKKLAGKTVQIRFRVATDSAAGAAGWQIDDIVVAGITNTPFSAWVPDGAMCAGEETSTSDTATESMGTSDSASDTGGIDDDGGCGCRSGGPGAGLAPLGLVLLGLARRRRRH